jgi:integrase/recombinase XerD
MGYAKEWLTVDEWKKLRSAPGEKNYQRGNTEMKSWREELLLKVTYRGGLRISEALDLQYPYNFRVEEGQGYVVLKDQKTDEGDDEIELQPVGKELVREVSRFMSAYYDEAETNFVFNNGQGGRMSRQRAYQIINELREVVGIEKKLGTHTLRRSRAKHLLESGSMDLSEVSRFLRHDRISTTMDYLDIAKKQMAEKSSQIDEDLGL